MVFFVDHCPVCTQGLIRVRTRVEDKRLIPICLCDECDAAWEDPTLTKRIARESLQDKDLWGDHTHWASIEEICLYGWYSYIQPKLKRLMT